MIIERWNGLNFVITAKRVYCIYTHDQTKKVVNCTHASKGGMKIIHEIWISILCVCV